jgi:hypothetical protein
VITDIGTGKNLKIQVVTPPPPITGSTLFSNNVTFSYDCEWQSSRFTFSRRSGVGPDFLLHCQSLLSAPSITSINNPLQVGTGGGLVTLM